MDQSGRSKGLKVDGLEPSEDMLEMIGKEKRGELTTEEIRAILVGKYKKNKKGKQV